LLEGFWGSFGWELSRARTVKDVRSALRSLDEGIQHSIQLFTRETTAKTTPVELRLRKKQSAQLSERVRVAAEKHQECLRSLEKVTNALEQARSTPQEADILRVFERRTNDCNEAQKLSQDLMQKERLLQEQLADERAFFAQAELLCFVHSRRYSFNPTRLANAMAGLPDMGWRRSAILCARHKPHWGEGRTYWLFKLLRRVLSARRVNRATLVASVKAALQTYRDQADYRLLDARKNWYHLRRAIEAAIVAPDRSSSLPYRILALYQHYIEIRNSLELFLEEEEQL